MKVINQFLENLKNNSSFKVGTDLADMQLISKYNKRIKFLLCVIDIFSKCAWVVPLKDNKGIVNAFQSILESSKRKASKSVFQWLKDNDVY